MNRAQRSGGTLHVRGHKPHLTCFVVLLALSSHCQSGGDAPSLAEVAKREPLDVEWTRLRFEADRFGVRVTTRLDLARSSLHEMQAPPYAALGNEEFQSVVFKVMRLDVHARAESVFRNYATQGRVWFVPQSLAVLQRDRLKPGPDGARKMYRYAVDGAFRIRVEPSDSGEGKLPPGGWTKVKRKFYPYDLLAAGCDRVTSPELLLYRASSRDPENGGKPSCVFVDDALYRVWLVAGGEVPRPVDYVLKAGGGARQVSGKRKVLKLSLRVEQITRGADAGAFELLELRGAIVIYVDPAHRLPVLITGERGGVGELSTRLVEADLRR
jgi:hypothetical protein